MGLFDDLYDSVSSAASRAIDSVSDQVVGDATAPLVKIGDDPAGALTALQLAAGQYGKPPAPTPPSNIQAVAQHATATVAAHAGLSVGVLVALGVAGYFLFGRK